MSSVDPLFDANAIIDLLNAGEYDRLFDGATLDLSFYEATSALWHKSIRSQRLARDDARDLVEQIDDLRGEMRVIDVDDISAGRLYETAAVTSLTVYDAAYVAAAAEFELTVVTNDGGIHDHAPDGVDVVRPGEL